MVLLAHTDSILPFTIVLVMLHIFNPNLNPSLRVWQGQDTNKRSQNNAVAKKIAFMMYTDLRSMSFNCQARYIFMVIDIRILQNLSKLLFKYDCQ